jgi:hypothetical protein
MYRSMYVVRVCYTHCSTVPVCTSAPVPGKLPKNFRDLMSCFCIVMTGTNTTQW